MDDGVLAPVGAEASMAEVVAAWDWSSTPVGDPSTWPPALRTVVQLMLTSRFPMWAGWGPELTFFYNDAYRRDTLGFKHPWALGRPAREVWAEIWEDIGPRIQGVLETGEATWDEGLLLFLERSGYREETYHTFSYSPIADDRGGVAGMLCVVTEETDRVIGERRMATLRELAADLSGRHVEDEVVAAARRRLAANGRDLPFSSLYLVEGGVARLAAATGAGTGAGVAPAEVTLDDAAAWPIGEVLAAGATRVVGDLDARFDSLPTGTWDDPPHQAAVVPLTQRGQTRPVGALVVGLNPYRPVDPASLSFLELLADQISAGIAGARSYEAERRRAESLAELDRAKTEFFSNVSHELRTPLTLIAGPVEDSLRDDADPLPARHRERLEVVRRNTGRLRRLVNNMLDFARIEAGRVAPERVATNLTEVTRDLVASFAPAIERAGLALDVDCPPLARPVYVDRDMWEKVVLNLLSNALKFTLEGSISVSLREDVDGPVLEVRDSGVGIPADQVAHLFDRFHRVAGVRARSHEGTGIGLALVQQLVHLHDGKVSVSSVEGAGTTFTVRLPYGSGATGAATPYESSLAAYLDEALQWTSGVDADPDADDARTEGTVLVVDDNPDLRDYIARLLRPHWRVVLATDGHHALDLVATTVPDLVLSDVMMPNLDGFQLLDALRRDPRTATVPVILLSARAGEGSTIEGLDAGADDYLVKPFSSTELLARVRSALLLGRLRNREAAWRAALVEALDEGVMIADANGTLVELNGAAGTLLGLSQDAAPYPPPHPFWPDAATHPDDREAVQAAFAQVLTSGSFHGRLRFRHTAGHVVPVDVAVRSIFDGPDRMFVATVRDLTDDLRSAERQEALARFAAGLSRGPDGASVLDAGVAELRAAFGAGRVLAARWSAGGGEPVLTADPPGPTWDDLDAATRDQLAAAALRPGDATVVEPAQLVERAGGPPALAVAAGTTERPVALLLEPDGGRPFSVEERSLVPVLAGHLGQALARAQLFEDQRQIATAMQRSILGPVDVLDGIDVRYAPAELPLQVGGDWYDVVDLGAGRTGLVVGDCVGHGLQAATIMGQLRSAARALLLHTGRPAEVLRALDAFAALIPGARCTTALCAVVDGDEVRYSAAGHLPPVLVHADGRLRLLDEGRSVPLASMAVAGRPEATAVLEPGSILLLYTDGLIERRTESLDVGLARLGAAVVEHRALDGEALIDATMAAVLPGGRHADDVAVVVYRHAGRPAELRARIPADVDELASLRHDLRAWLDGTGADAQTATDLLIAVGEACTNSMEHAYGFAPGRTLEVTARRAGGSLEVTVVDDGPWRRSGALGPDRGYGLPIMRGLVDDVRIDRAGAGTTVVLRKGLVRG